MSFYTDGRRDVGPLWPAVAGEAITPNDSTTYEHVRSVYVGGTGDVSVVLDGVTVLFESVQAGTFMPISPTVVRATNTTATGIVILH